MAKFEKLVKRLLSQPRDFTWNELTTLLSRFGYTELRGGKNEGSRRNFSDGEKNIISLHKPHRSNILKTYQLKEVIGS